ncbi:hypothetical protein [Candidatus Bathycorpusculum sp.]|uniref:hypothetical protein n=1 Tax=Candidatus Bathycorpusculum sp. TaxID=2994959 RepID=UPI0028285B4D|nr:hypothetical protein [Candidatus Termitimicrobium sp.]MCL2686216.1 hypothetical protein [Candidatus Termitimicrobium sp.]
MAISRKNKQKHTIADTPQVDENLLFLRVAEIIENRKKTYYCARQSRNYFDVLGSWAVC